MKMETCINQATPALSQLWGDGITEPALEASHEGWLRSPPDLLCSGATAAPAPTAPSLGAEQHQMGLENCSAQEQHGEGSVFQKESE